MVSVEFNNDFAIVKLSGEFTIFYINDYYAEFCEVDLGGANKIIFNLSNLEEIDSSGYQLIKFIKQSLLSDRHVSIYFEGNKEVETFFQAYGLSTVFDI